MTRPTRLGKSYGVAFSRDGKRLATFGRDVWVWDVDRREKCFRSHPVANPSCADFSPDGHALAVKNTHGRIVVISSQSGELLSDFKNDADTEGSNVLYSACGQYLVDGTWGGRLNVRRVDSGVREFSVDFPGEMIRQVHRCGSGERWVVAHGPKAVTHDQPPPDDYFSVWQWPLRAGHHERAAVRIAFAQSSALDSDGQLIAVVHGAPPNRLSVFNLASGACMGSVEVSSGGCGSAIAWSPDGRQIASVQDSVVRLFEFPGLAQTHEVFLAYPSDVAYPPDGGLLALGSWTMGWLLPGEVLAATAHLSLTPARRNPVAARSRGCL